MADTLKQLLAQSQQLTSHIASEELPQIERGLDQIENQSRKLVAKAAQDRDIDAKAHFFLAGAGVNAEEILENLNSVNLATTFEPLVPIHDSDIDGYLRHQREQIIVSAIEESRRTTTRDFDELFSRSINGDWERTKKRIFEELGQHQGDSYRGGDTMRGSLAKSMRLGKSTFSQVQPAMSTTGGMTNNARTNRFAVEMENLNESRLRKTAYAVFQGLEKSSAELKMVQMQQAFNIIQHVIGEGNASGATIPVERSFAKAYLYEPYDSAPAIALRESLALGGRQHLESSYLKFIEEQIRLNPEAAQRGGSPSIKQTIRAYLNVKYMKYGTWKSPPLERVGGQPIYAMTYFLLRTGHGRKALEYLKSFEGQMPEKDQHLVTAMRQYMDSTDRRLTTDVRNNLLSKFNERFRNAKGDDPYLLALYKIIGRCDLAKKIVADVISSTQDWMWLQFMLVRENEDADGSTHERYRLRDLQNSILRFGPQHFDQKGNNPLHYAHLLLQSAQFEEAVGYLYDFEQYRTEAVQMAAGFAYYGLLRVCEKPDVGNPEIRVLEAIETGEEVTSINLARLCANHSRSLQKSIPHYALHYLIVLCLNASDHGGKTTTDDHYTAVCHDLIVKLTSSTREYDRLLGTNNPSTGSRTTGLAEHYMPLINIADRASYKTELVRATANYCLQEGALIDAIKLYDLAEDYNTVVILFNRELGASLQKPSRSFSSSMQLSADSPESDLQKMAHETVNGYYMNRPEILTQIEQRQLETFRTLLELSKFMDEHQRGQHSQALQRMKSLNFIPLEGDNHRISQTASSMRNLDEVLANQLGDILLATMTTICKLFEKIKSSAGGEQRREQLADLRAKADAVSKFTTNIKYRLNNETYGQLSRLDVFLK